MRVSVVIASLNEGENIIKTVRSCVETSADLGPEIVVADDASTDGSIEELRRQFPEVRVVGRSERIGVSATKDLAGRSARGEVLVFLDGHCKPEPGAIARLAQTVDETGGRAVISPAVPALDTGRWENNMWVVGHGGYTDLEQCSFRWIGLDAMKKSEAFPGRDLYESPCFAGCCLAMTRDLYEHLKGFDTDMRMWGVEDLDFSVKAWLMGCPLLHDPEPVVGHRFRASFDNYTAPMEHVMANHMRMSRKIFTDPVWDAWLGAFRGRTQDWLFNPSWALFEERRDTAEREREYLMANRVHDEFWYARRFDVPFPKAPEVDAETGDAAGENVIPGEAATAVGG